MEKEEHIFNGEIGQNIPSSNAKREEDLLETMYLWWKGGRPLTVPNLCVCLDLSRRELNHLVKKMVGHGYLHAVEKDEELKLTAFGKAQGAECQARHQYLTQFLQMACDLEEEEAQENTCRVEHVVSKEVIQGICEFLKYGDTYDRVIHNLDLCTIYEEGSYEFCMSIYRTEQRYPRILADEFYAFHDCILLEVDARESWLYLREKDDNFSRILWYKTKGGWTRAKKEAKGFRVPTDLFAFTVSTAVLITEGDGMVAFTDTDRLPGEEDCRELNIHIW